MWNKIRNKYFGNKIQTVWHILLIVFLILAIISPFLRIYIFGIFKSLFGADKIDHICFKTWDSIAIILSIFLSIVLYIETFFMKDKIIEKFIPNKWKGIIGLLVALSIYCLTKAIKFLFIDNYPGMLKLLILTTFVYLIYDIVTIKILQNAYKCAKKNKKLIENKKQKYIKNLFYGDIPAISGFCIILLFYYCWQSAIANTDGNNPESLLFSFVAGSAAIHAVFGNVVVGLSLGEDE